MTGPVRCGASERPGWRLMPEVGRRHLDEQPLDDLAFSTAPSNSRNKVAPARHNRPGSADRVWTAADRAHRDERVLIAGQRDRTPAGTVSPVRPG